jgi:hypothetical protein
MKIPSTNFDVPLHLPILGLTLLKFGNIRLASRIQNPSGIRGERNALDTIFDMDYPVFHFVHPARGMCPPQKNDCRRSGNPGGRYCQVCI